MLNNIRFHLLIVIAVILLAQLPAQAAPDRLVSLADLRDGDRAGYTGVYVISGKARAAPCAITLTDEPAAPGYALKIPARCKRVFPLLAGMTAWRLYENDDIQLIGPQAELWLRQRTRAGVYHLHPRVGGMSRFSWDGTWDTGD
ncbi:AprI/Inh family metalloprotease inhibitor [Oryzibacter oryziterrae]|uniref:AprI/Inh family metalloprotease inhibitor n=1 Tax=Oryzibacter oryziterrae TaxID=2766474 RepID=UPI001F3922DB|nr:hypothetical protein [Oryzibacter oryziterrae]